ncbi:MFS transporter [Shimazuella kribbensis]|uniref:MFS transporter n=1 Tax=Shimazuella kribbensis TaxID=139808 RepID=UPI0004221C62|nr:MFS transporter [Shimazuella kribbensis]
METKVSEHTGEILMRIVMFTVMLSSMSVLMFMYVLPQISKEFHLSISQVSWLSSSYGIIYAIGTVTYGKLADRFKLKDLLTVGIIIFAIGSLIGLISQTFWMALVGRCLQAIGAGTIPAVAILIPIRYFSPENRGKALGMMAVGLALGGVLGPVVSSFIASMVDWHWLFAVSLLILFTLPFYRKYLNEEEEKSHDKFDWLGGSLLSIAIICIMISVTNGVWWLAIVAIFMMSIFIGRIRVTKNPFISPKLFLNKAYTLHIILAFLINGIGIGLYFLVPLLLTEVQKFPASWVGFAMVPAAVASVILGRVGGKLADTRGNKNLYLIAASSLFLCFILLSTFIESSAWFVAMFLVFGTVGQSFMLIVLSNSTSQTLPKDQAGLGMGLMQMFTFISQGVGTAILSRVLDNGSTVFWNPFTFANNGYIFSNIFLTLAILHVLLFLFYYFRVRKAQSSAI